MSKLSAVIIAFDEEKNIGECLASLIFCDETVVVDSGSQDKTVTIAQACGAKVYSNGFVDFASQKNFGIQKASGEWVLLVDADERVSEVLAEEIKRTLESPRFDGYYLTRLNRIFGRWMRHGDNQKDLQLRLVRKDKAHFTGVVHERIYLKEKTGVLKGLLLHYSTENVSSYMKKLNHYTGLEVVADGSKYCRQPKPMILRPLSLFFYRAILQKGFLDGLEGIFFCILSAYYEFLRQVKQWELQTETNK